MLRSWFISAAAFCAGVAASLVLLEWQMPRVLTAISGDFARVAKLRLECDVLVVGPSFVKNQFFPAIFEEESSRLGTDVRACHFSGAGMSSYEMMSRAMDLIDLGFPELDLVVFDITMGAVPGFQKDNRYKTRMVQWHTAGVLPFAYRTYTEAGLGPAQVMGLLIEHAKHVLARVFRLGEAHLWLEGLHLVERASRWAGNDTELPATRVQRINSKVLAGVNRLPQSAHTRKKPKWTSYDQKVHDDELKRLVREKMQVLGDRAAIGRAFAHELRTRSRARGVEAVFLIAPTWKAVSPPGDPLAETDPLEILDFNLPIRYPELYDIDARGRGNHINGPASVIYTKLLAKALIDRGWIRP